VGGQKHQSFALSRQPITRLRTTTFPGAAPELKVTVDGDEWRRVETFAGIQGSDRAFELWIDESAKPRVVFGSGHVGARLPTGRENVKAAYRIGIGAGGNVTRGRLKLAVDHPVGVREVSNVRASGGSDREPTSRVRSITPLSTITLDRLVSATDYHQAARALPGIAKAKARVLSLNGREVIVVSILENGILPLEADSEPCHLLQAMLTNGEDGSASVFVLPGVLCPLFVSAKIKTRGGASWENTAKDVRAALIASLGFEQREIGQPAYASEALAAIQTVKAVDYAVLTNYHRFNPDLKTPVNCQSSIQAFPGGRGDDGNLRGGEMLLIQPHIASSINLDPIQ
jgi:predicted phage baseplate assembly protein